MFADLSIGRLVGAVAITVTAFVASGCGGTIDGHAQPAIDVVPATSSAGPTTKPSGKPTTSKPAQTSTRGGNTDFQANVGDCVALGGTVNDATIAKASCGSRSSNYKVIGKAKNSTGCVSDRDNFYAETLNGIETGALCLDIDWVVGGCMDVGGDEPKRIECTESGSEAVKVITIKTGTDSVDDCPDVADSGFKYPERKVVVCVQSL
ncbi:MULTISPECIES: LppU family putative lipoprotein [unclassified Nocardia]|uniref:LppU family putative lipoprotein n=1 Tax=unclassified Nocardia TaxID=2637762 RepID=UPI0033AB6149